MPHRSDQRSAEATPRLRGRKAVEQRKRRLWNEPLCRDCKEQGRITASVTPDHIIPLAKGGSDTDDNIRCLCEKCHHKRTAQQFGFKDKGTDISGRPTSPDHPWNASR